jgi:hypothetical protein
MWNEWTGKGAFITQHGGIAALELTMKTKWRSHFTTPQVKQFSRLKFIVGRIAKEIELSNESVVLVKYDALFKENPSLSSLEKYLKKNP